MGLSKIMMNIQTKEASHSRLRQEAGKEPIAFPESVCHRTIRGEISNYPQAEFHGQTIYFCTETCKSVFLSDPERFYAAHSKRRP
jgi:YHS domain-containing protein